MPADDRPPWIDFGQIIAFLAPGFLVLFSYASGLPADSRWISLATQKDQSVGVFFLVFLASLSIGLVVSGIRDLTVDSILRWLHKAGGGVTRVNWSRLTKDKTRLLLLARDNYFRFYQFYANSAVAIAAAAIIGRVSSSTSSPWLTAAEVIAALALLGAAKRELGRYLDAVEELGLGASSMKRRPAE